MVSSQYRLLSLLLTVNSRSRNIIMIFLLINLIFPLATYEFNISSNDTGTNAFIIIEQKMFTLERVRT